MLKCMDEMKSAHLRNLPKAGLTTCGFENCVTVTEKSKQRVQAHSDYGLDRMGSNLSQFPVRLQVILYVVGVIY